MATKKVGTLIKEARTNADMTQEQLARRIPGISASDISLAERGKMDLTQEQLKQIAKATQVICVTHSAQIASLAENHFLIAKHDVDGRTQTEVTQLDEEGSVLEVARILGGIEVTESQLCAAREMIEDGKQY